MVRALNTVSFVTALLVSSSVAAPVHYGRSLSNGLSQSLGSIGGRISSNWRNSRLESSIVQTVVESVAVESVSDFSQFSSFESDSSELDLILSDLSPFDLSLSNQDILDLVPSVFESFDESDVILEMVDQVMEILLAGLLGSSGDVFLNSNSIEVESVSQSISNNLGLLSELVGTEWRNNQLQSGIVQALIGASALQISPSSSISDFNINSIIGQLNQLNNIVIEEQDVQTIISSSEQFSDVEFVMNMLEQVIQLPGFVLA